MLSNNRLRNMIVMPACFTRISKTSFAHVLPMGKTGFAHPVKTMAKAGQNWLPGKTSFDRPVKTAVLTGQNWPVGKTCQPWMKRCSKSWSAAASSTSGK